MNIELFEFYRGDDQCFHIEVVEDTDDDSVVPVDITGWSFTTTFKLSPSHADNARTSLQIYTPRLFGEDATKGTYFLTIPGSKSKQMIPASYFFDIQRELDGVTTTVIVGRVRVLADITRKAIS